MCITLNISTVYFQIEEEHKEALSIISMIGCIVSMICLVLNVAIHAFFWRFAIFSIREKRTIKTTTETKKKKDE
jgi:hypothetical protein